MINMPTYAGMGGMVAKHVSGYANKYYLCAHFSVVKLLFFKLLGLLLFLTSYWLP